MTDDVKNAQQKLASALAEAPVVGNHLRSGVGRLELLLTALMQEVRAARYRPEDDLKLYTRHLQLDLKLTVLMMFVGLNIFFTFLILILVPNIR